MTEQTNTASDSMSKDLETRSGLIRELESIQGETIEDLTFDFSNDREVEKWIPEIARPTKASNALLKIVVIVSHGALWNIPKEIEGVDLVLRIDKNRSQLKRDRERRTEILEAESPNDLLPKPNVGLDKSDFAAVKKER